MVEYKFRAKLDAMIILNKYIINHNNYYVKNDLLGAKFKKNYFKQN